MADKREVSCAACNRLLKNVPGRKRKLSTDKDVEYFYNITGQLFSIGDILCNKCRLKKYRDLQVLQAQSSINNNNTPSNSSFATNPDDINPGYDSDDINPGYDSDDINPGYESDDDFVIHAVNTNNDNISEHIELMISRTVSTHKYCCLCSKKTNITTVPQIARVQAYTMRKIFIPKGNRCCRDHLIKNRFFDNCLNDLRAYSPSSVFDLTDLTTILGLLGNDAKNTMFTSIGNFSLSDNDIKVFTGLTWENITAVTNLLSSSLRDTKTRSVVQAVVVFLMKLRTGNSNVMIKTILQLPYEQAVSEYVGSVINAFEIILPLRFGIKSCIRQDLIVNHTTIIANELCGTNDTLIVICDGTYASHQKSKNNNYQRKSYSGQKKKHLCKPFTICATDGFVIDMLGPYTANENDASILRKIMDDPSTGLSSLMCPGDIFVLDRGFRDIVPYLETKGFKVLMPALKGNRKQLTCQEANESRFVTKIRWPVEAVHGMIKQKNKLLDNVINNKILPKTGSLYRIASYLLNGFGKRLTSDATTTEEVLNRFHSMRNIDNTLENEVEKNGWLRKKLPFEAVDSSAILDFPELTEREMIILFTGR